MSSMTKSKTAVSGAVRKKPVRKNVQKRNEVEQEEKRRQLIAEAAYYLAEERGFKGGCQLHDWLEAEAKIEHIYGKC